MIRFAKLSQNNWAVEVAGQASDGTFDYDTDKRDGQLLAGTIAFNGDGSVRESILEDSITVNWNNGSLPSTINIDWAAFGGDSNSIINRGIRQTAAPNDAVSKPNGNTAGALESVSIDEQGFVTGSFSNGLTRKLYQIPIVTFANINGLEAGDGDTYTATRLSGPAMLKFAGVGGNATILAKAVEGSNTETTKELLKIQELQNQIQAEARVVGVDNQNFKTILSELSR
jgi:flagellar hook protein FlgE